MSASIFSINWITLASGPMPWIRAGIIPETGVAVILMAGVPVILDGLDPAGMIHTGEAMVIRIISYMDSTRFRCACLWTRSLVGVLPQNRPGTSS